MEFYRANAEEGYPSEVFVPNSEWGDFIARHLLVYCGDTAIAKLLGLTKLDNVYPSSIVQYTGIDKTFTRDHLIVAIRHIHAFDEVQRF